VGIRKEVELVGERREEEKLIELKSALQDE